MNTEKSLVFISYSWLDSISARSIAFSLEKHGYKIWIDYRNLDLSKPLKPQLNSAIKASDALLLVSSPNIIFV
ncbi:MAG: TIR domain-containing protein [Leptolyngbya sp. SIOISBB]|nr:TIR domain-containing protein [Leptolyngbya sp. SIOISBB]